MDMITQSVTLFLKNCFASLLSDTFTDFGSRMAAVTADCHRMLGIVVPQYLQELDDTIAQDARRMEEWEVVRKDERSLTCVFGEIRFRRRYYRHRQTGEMAYLLDRFLGIQAHAKVNGDARQKAVSLAEHESYARSAAESSNSGISRMSVCNYVGCLENFPVLKAEGGKRSVRQLYVEADEDHAALQEGTQAQVKLVYIHEGVEEKGGRRTLVRPRYLTWPSRGNTDALWETISDYIRQQYVSEDVEHIFLSGDGGSWIRRGEEWLYPCVPILDAFHTGKALKKLCGNRTAEASAFMRFVRNDEKKKARELCRSLLRDTPEPWTEEKRKAANYLLNNWQRIRNQRHPGAHGCSAEGHVSHILSERLSSRPRGWSRRNMENIAQLRVMKANGQEICFEQLCRPNLRKEAAAADTKAAALALAPGFRNSLKKRARSTFAASCRELPILTRGVITPLYQALHALSFDSFVS